MEQRWIERAVSYRRIFHQYPEPGWLTFFASAYGADHLNAAGYEVHVGREILGEEPLMDPPGQAQISQYEDRAKISLTENAVSAGDHWLKRMDHRTGVIAFLDTKRPGITRAYRFDMDALPIRESDDESRCPIRENFSSKYPENSHACGHDGHMAIGLTFAEWLAEHQNLLSGKHIFIFQPAEEGVRGAKAFCNCWRYGKIDELYCCHIGFAPRNTFVAGAEGFLATTKFDVTFHGKSAHAGLTPELGRNALVAAAESIVEMQKIKRPQKGITRLNVGTIEAGEARNSIPASAFMRAETRGNTEELNEYMKKSAISCIEAACRKYEVGYEITYQGESTGAESAPELSEKVLQIAKSCGDFSQYRLSQNFGASDDGAVFMNMVQKQGGRSTYMLFGTEILGSHHEPQFDFNEDILRKALSIYEKLAI